MFRAAILDAPLSEDVRPFMGDAMAAAILGYDDEDWAVRNSSTMVFAACIVRIIDADKNASETTKTGGVKVILSSRALALYQLDFSQPRHFTFFGNPETIDANVIVTALRFVSFALYILASIPRQAGYFTFD